MLTRSTVMRTSMADYWADIVMHGTSSMCDLKLIIDAGEWIGQVDNATGQLLALGGRLAT